LAARVKHVVLGDWFWRWNLVFKGGGNVNPIFSMYIIISCYQIVTNEAIWILRLSYG
jgi:hypothetical protein